MRTFIIFLLLFSNVLLFGQDREAIVTELTELMEFSIENAKFNINDNNSVKSIESPRKLRFNYDLCSVKITQSSDTYFTSYFTILLYCDTDCIILNGVTPTSSKRYSFAVEDDARRAIELLIELQKTCSDNY